MLIAEQVGAEAERHARRGRYRQAVQALVTHHPRLVELRRRQPHGLAVLEQGLVGHQRGHHVALRARQRMRRCVVDEIAVFDAAHTGRHGVLDGGGAVGMGRRGATRCDTT